MIFQNSFRSYISKKFKTSVQGDIDKLPPPWVYRLTLEEEGGGPEPTLAGLPLFVLYIHGTLKTPRR